MVYLQYKISVSFLQAILYSLHPKLLVILPFLDTYSLHTQKTWRLGQRHGLQNTILTSYFSKNIYQKVIYVYFHKSIFQDKSIHIIFIFSNSITWELFIIYILKVWLKHCPKRQVFLGMEGVYTTSHRSNNNAACLPGCEVFYLANPNIEHRSDCLWHASCTLALICFGALPIRQFLQF